MSVDSEIGPERTRLGFADAVTEAFAFLGDLGFAVAESQPTLVRYRKGDLEAWLYHGRQSFEVGFEIVRDGESYSLSELIRAVDRAAGEGYRNWMVARPEGIAKALARLKDLVRRYGESALRGDPQVFETLTKLRQEWSENYALDVRASQLRPKADAAFRSRNYREAVALYEEIQPRLSPTELEKLALAKRRAQTQG
jgi:hypothetical protein